MNPEIKIEIQKKTNLFSIPIFSQYSPDGGGSGTLVFYNGRKFILTAAHILKGPCGIVKFIRLPYKLRIGTTNIWELISLEIKPYLFDHPNFSTINWSAEFLDLALIEVRDSKIFGDILAVTNKRCFNLDEARQKYPYLYDSIWTIQGFPRQNNGISVDNIYEFNYSGAYIGGAIWERQKQSLKHAIYKEFRASKADLIMMPVGPTEDKLPSDFAGASGAGLWNIRIYKTETGYNIKEMNLGGIFVAASKDNSKLYCRGYESLYETFLPYLDMKFNR